MKSKNRNHFIEKIFSAADLVEGVDYEISSFFVFNEWGDCCPINGQFGIDALSVVGREKTITHGKVQSLLIKEIARKTGIISSSLIPTPKPNQQAHFYKIVSPIDYDTAISLGFGIVRLLKHPYQNEFLLYFFNTVMEDDNVDYDFEAELDEEDEFDLYYDEIDEEMMLKCYLQLTENGRFHDESLADYIEENIEYLYILLAGDPNRLIDKVLMSLDKNRGQLLLFPGSENGWIGTK